MKSLYKDQEIIESIKNGGRELERSMEYIYNSEVFRDSVFRFVQSRNGNEQDAEDVFQDGIRNLIVCVREGKYRGDGTLSAYLYNICKNLWYKQFHKQTKHDDYNPSEFLHVADEETPEVLLAGKEMELKVSELLSQVGEKCKQVLEMWNLNFSMREIAESLGYKSEGVARKKKHQCFKSLLELIENNPTLKTQLTNLL